MNRYFLAFKAMSMIGNAIESLVDFSSKGDIADFKSFKANSLFGVYITEMINEEVKENHGNLNDLKKIRNLYKSFEVSYKKINQNIRLEYHMPSAADTLLAIYTMVGDIISQEMVLDGLDEKYASLDNLTKAGFIVAITEGEFTAEEAHRFMRVGS